MGHSPKRVLVWGPRRDARPAGERRSGGALEGCLSHRDSDPTWSKARAADRRDETIAIVCASNPSVSQSADTSPYTGEALGWCDAEGEAKLYTDNPSVTAAPCHFSLRLGHGAALIYHRHIIHYRAATSLPLTQGRLWVGAMPKARWGYQFRYLWGLHNAKCRCIILRLNLMVGAARAAARTERTTNLG